MGREWEAATEPARAAGIRVVLPRFGMVLSPAGGALGRMLPPFRLGLGGPLGSGRQWMSWIAIDDLLGAIHHALMTDALAGPVNATAPAPGDQPGIRQRRWGGCWTGPRCSRCPRAGAPAGLRRDGGRGAALGRPRAARATRRSRATPSATPSSRARCATCWAGCAAT